MSETTTKTIAQRLKDVRKKRNITQVQAAREMELHYQTYRLYEYGAMPGDKALLKVTAWLKRFSG